MPSTTQVLSIVGAVVALQAAYNLLRFVALYTLPSKVHRYLYGPAPYALVTGASDGIGKAVSKELYSLGFNLVIHGRNGEKLETIRQEINNLPLPKKDVKIWVADANSPDIDFEAAVAQWEGLEITLVVHNVGSAPVRTSPIDGIPTSAIMADIYRNALFPLFLTRALLPKLRRASGPAELVFCGSNSWMLPIPRIIPYGATKAFLRQLSPALQSDELFHAARPPNVSTVYMDIGSVATASHKVAPSFTSPSADLFAKRLVHCIGCGRERVFPYWPQALMAGMVSLLPQSVMLPELFKAMDRELEVARSKKD